LKKPAPKKGYQIIELRFKKFEEIPDSWEEKRLDSFLTINMGQSPPSSSYNSDSEGLPFIQGVTEFCEKYPTTKIWCNDPKKIADENDILFSVRAPVGELNIAQTKTCIGRGVAALKPKDKHDLFYCYYLLKQYIHRFIPYSQGIPYNAINKPALAQVKFPVAPEPTQKRISLILQNVDHVIENLEKTIEKTQRLKKGVMQKLFVFGYNHKKSDFKKVKYYHRTSIEIPKTWEWTTFEKLKIKSGGTPDTKNREYYENGTIPWIPSEELDNEILNETVQSITKNAVKQKNLKIYPKGTFVMAIVGLEAEGTRGRCAILGIDATVSQSCAAFEIPENLNSFFLFYFYQFFSEKIFWTLAQGTKQQSLLPHILNEVKFPIPPEPEQEKIVSIIQNLDNLISKYEKETQKLELLKKGIMQKLLSGEVRVKV
tara:strand:- start:578 stop:1861 length:1284 start_codon:yes stop_codon:yes gene_type:complete